MSGIPGEIQKIRVAILDRVAAALPGYCAVYVYGSRVNGPVRPDSDLDLALLMPVGARTSAQALVQLRGDLESVAGLPVEVSLLDPASALVHCKEVVTTGVLLDVRDRGAVDRFEMQVLADYADFCRARRPVVAAYQATPVHG